MNYRLTVLFVILLFAVVYAAAQNGIYNKVKLQNRDEIELTSGLIVSTDESTEVSLNKLLLLNKQILLRKNFIVTLDKELVIVGSKIEALNYKIKALTDYLNHLTYEYERLVRFAWYSRKSYPNFMFVLAANSFNQAFLRFKYLTRIAVDRQKNLNSIALTKKENEHQLVRITEIKKDYEALLKDKLKETEILSDAILKQNEIVLKLQTQHIANGTAEAESTTELDESITNIILAGERAAKLDFDRESKVTYNNDVETGGIADYRGKLPWPVKKGVVVSSFGEQAHPYLKGIKVMNNGIEISTNSGTKVYPVYEGVVVKVMKIPGSKNAILLSHNNYYTLYGNIDKVNVSVGEAVFPHKAIGVLNSDIPKEKVVRMQFQVWYKNMKQNPSAWLRRKN
ncbi:MAG TPA: hypothetical protein DCQ31_07730 [Bacteroidales bacterium]|nr:hypothetical protein [Bacteroidales bacterium]